MITKQQDPISVKLCEICKSKIAPRGSSKIICQPCYRKKHLKEKPKWYLDQQKKSYKKKKDEVRKKRGISLDHPRCIAHKGEGHKETHGYKTVWAPYHPNCKNKKGRIYEHIFVMSNHLGRPLQKGETVHHKNGIRDDNRIENLELWSTSHPSGQRVEDKIEWYIKFLNLYGYTVTKM